MQRYFIINLFVILLGTSGSNLFAAQNIEPSDSITIQLQSGSLVETLQEIASITGYRFAYRQNLIEEKQQDYIKFSGVFNDLLSTLFTQHQLCYTVKGKQIIVHTACRPKQYSISGIVIDSSTNAPIPYASLNIIHTAQGVIADHEGYFEMKLSGTRNSDTLVISCMGYRRDTLIITRVLGKEMAIVLAPKVYSLPEAIVRPYAYETVQIGNKKDKELGSIYLDTHGQQAALYIENGRQQVGIIESVEYYLSKRGNTKAPFRVRIYGVDSAGMPGDDLVKDVIVVKPEKSDGWYRIEIEKEGILFPKEGVFIAIEGVFPDDYNYYMGSVGFIDLREGKKQKENKGLPSYGQRLGYNRKGRKNTWHYSMDNVWFQLSKQSFGVMITADVKFEKNTDNYDQDKNNK